MCRPAGRLRQTRVVELGQAVAPMVCQSHAHARAARWGVAAGRAGPAMGRPAGNAATGTLAARRAGPIAAARPSSLAPAVWPVAGGGKGRPGPLAARSVGGAEDQCPAPENIREVLEYRLQKLCPCRPVRQGGLFLDLVLLENGTPGLPQDSIPLWNATGSRKSRLALARLPAHQRNMVRQLQAGGHRVFACVDPLCSMPEMQLWTVSLWWQADIKFFQPIEKEDGISTERGKNI